MHRYICGTDFQKWDYWVKGRCIWRSSTYCQFPFCGGCTSLHFYQWYMRALFLYNLNNRVYSEFMDFWQSEKWEMRFQYGFRISFFINKWNPEIQIHGLNYNKSFLWQNVVRYSFNLSLNSLGKEFKRGQILLCK